MVMDIKDFIIILLIIFSLLLIFAFHIVFRCYMLTYTNKIAKTIIYLEECENKKIDVNINKVITFLQNENINELDKIFTEKNCEKITIDDKYIHTGYTIKFNIRKEFVETEKSTPENDIKTEERIFVCLAQRTYSETKLKEIINIQKNQDAVIAEILFGGVEE